jgi:gliding motility-associated-like protein
MYEFFEDGSIKDYVYDDWLIFIPQSVISSSSGKPLFVNNAWDIKNLSGKKISGSDSIIPLMGGYSDVFLQRNDSTYDLFGGYDSIRTYRAMRMFYPNFTGYEFDALADYESGIYRHSLVSSQGDWVMYDKNSLVIPFIGDAFAPINTEHIFNFNNVNRRMDYSYSTIYEDAASSLGYSDTSSLYLAQIENGNILGVEKITLDNPIALFQEPIPPADRVYRPAHTYGGVQTLRGDKVFFLSRALLAINVNGQERDYYESRGLWSVDLDDNGKMTSTPLEHMHIQQYSKTQYIPDGKGVYSSFDNLTISPNDSILYYEVFEIEIDSVDGKEIYSYSSSVKYWKFREAGSSPQDLMILPALNSYYDVDLSISPYGNLLISYDRKVETTGASGTVVNQLLQTNKPNGLNSTSSKQYLTQGFGVPNMNLYDYVRVKHTSTYECDALVAFENRSDLSEGIDSFVWIYSSEEGNYTDTVVSFEPTFRYSKNGDYPYKIHAFSGQSDYSEWYIDTLHIRIPPKPVALFNVSDTVVCAYKSIEFESSSQSDSIHKTKQSKLVWSFGDGETETVSTIDGTGKIAHTYTSAGTYTVSLFYSNGYCDSTLVKNQYIRVVDAPAPGFTVDNVRGCSPFSINVTDTITINTTKKEYNYYDGRGWVDVPVNQVDFSQTYPDAGTYWVVQRLYGYTGCVTQQDSVQIYVTHGLTDQDSVHVTLSTYPLHPSALGSLVSHSDGRQEWRANGGYRENIKVTWSTHPVAVGYKLSRNGSAIADIDATTTTFYRDSINRPDYYTYSIVGVDSCGTESSSGRTVSPIYLTGQAADNNKLAVIQFSPYSESLYEMRYEVLTEENGVWNESSPIADLGTQISYEDKEFLGDGSITLNGAEALTRLEKCYIIRNQYGDIYSNILCLPYKPTLFVPTAFSPNGDKLNDLYRPITFGIEHYVVTIYNRYGQLITRFDETSKGWEATDTAMGAYMVTIRAKGTDNRWYNVNQTVTVVK